MNRDELKKKTAERCWPIHVVAHTPQLLHETEGYLVFNEADRKIKGILE